VSAVTAKSLKQLASYQLSLLANLSTRHAMLHNEQAYGLAMRDWRILGLLGGNAPLSLNGVARDTGLDKSQASRAVTELIERGIVRSEIDPADGRCVRLSLTAAGRHLYERAFAEALVRNAELLSTLNRDEQEVFLGALQKLTHKASAMLAREREGLGVPVSVDEKALRRASENAIGRAARATQQGWRGDGQQATAFSLLSATVVEINGH
jgi:DNA-binding MarR family transcriptional regulator